ncbi:hypothetical protein [Sphingomonas sp. BK580]|uniref:hypothetical protein n=1 Tax=Sphingomonas sp. BK580 TaxID=2586972 RepID=UPI0016143A15|nr:hypothetical protein [Sphingomonas sp. BK580]MBB3692481.1 putative exporter [Sphingomonas sp. BK580]
MITRFVIGFAALTSLVGVGILLLLAFQRSPGVAYLGVMLIGIGRASRIALAIHGDG